MIEQTDCVAHYSKLKHVANILHDKKLLIGPVCNFADPRESSMDWLDTEGIGDGYDLDKRRAAEEMKRKAGCQVRLLCTAAPQKHVPGNDPTEEAIYGRPRMWAQYGDESRGFCVVLDREALNNELQKVAKRDEYLISGNVQYFDQLHRVGGSSTIQYGSDLDPRDSDIFEVMNENSMLRSTFFKKSIDWKHENEHRWLLFAQTEKEVYVSIEDSIKAVVLGSRFPPNEVSRVKDYCPEIGNPCFRLEYWHPNYQLLPIC